MALIYRYEIVNSIIRSEVNLTDYEDNIIKTIKSTFNNELKDCTVYKKYYEFKLYKQLTDYEKREFGKIILQECIELKAVFQNQKTKSYFRRMKQRYYAFFDSANDDIELIDAIDFEDEKSLLNKSKSYLSNLEKKTENTIFQESDNLQMSFYMDTFYLILDDENKALIEYTKSNRHRSEVLLLEGYGDSRQYENYLIADNHEQNPKYQESREGFNLKKVLLLNKDEIDKIKNTLKLDLTTNNNIFQNNIISKSKNIKLEVYDVGQALCTSISDNDFPILFFDFGNSSEKTSHDRILKLIHEYPPIFLSHIHRDHWNGINLFTEALSCNWYIPNQFVNPQFRKKCAEIIFIGGNVELINSNINLNFGEIIPSTSNSTLSKHETGNILYLKIKDKTILVAGDQIYSNIDMQYKKNIDILIASHHGGTYCQTTTQNYNDIPLANQESIVVYSANNTPKYYHPSHTEDYKKQGWINEHKTHMHGDYTL